MLTLEQMAAHGYGTLVLLVQTRELHHCYLQKCGAIGDGLHIYAISPPGSAYEFQHVGLIPGGRHANQVCIELIAAALKLIPREKLQC